MLMAWSVRLDADETVISMAVSCYEMPRGVRAGRSMNSLSRVVSQNCSDDLIFDRSSLMS